MPVTYIVNDVSTALFVNLDNSIAKSISCHAPDSVFQRITLKLSTV